MRKRGQGDDDENAKQKQHSDEDGESKSGEEWSEADTKRPTKKKAIGDKEQIFFFAGQKNNNPDAMK